MTTSETTETRRDLHADLALIEEVGAHQPGVWFVMHGTDVEREWPPGSCELDSVAYSAGSPSVAEFIAEARTGWPIAIERAISAEAENEMLRSTIMTVFQRARNDVNRREGGVCFGTTTFHDYPFAKRLVRDFEPIIFPEVVANE